MHAFLLLKHCVDFVVVVERQEPFIVFIPAINRASSVEIPNAEEHIYIRHRRRNLVFGWGIFWWALGRGKLLLRNFKWRPSWHASNFTLQQLLRLIYLTNYQSYTWMCWYVRLKKLTYVWIMLFRLPREILKCTVFVSHNVRKTSLSTYTYSFWTEADFVLFQFGNYVPSVLF